MISPIVCPIESQMAGSGPNRVEIANTANNPGPGEMAYTNAVSYTHLTLPTKA